MLAAASGHQQPKTIPPRWVRCSFDSCHNRDEDALTLGADIVAKVPKYLVAIFSKETKPGETKSPTERRGHSIRGFAMAKLEVLISGAGIAGCTLAYWLTRNGHSVTVVERSGSLRSSGSPVDVRGPAVDVAEPKKRGGISAETSPSVPLPIGHYGF